MKNWIKVLLGTFAGALVGALLPAHTEFLETAVRFLFELAVNFGKYIFIPLVFFSFAIEVYELYRQKLLRKTFGRALAFWSVVTAAAVLFAAVLTLLLSPQRLSHIVPESEVFEVPPLSDFLLSVIPANMLSVFFNPYGILFPVIVLALFMYNRVASQKVV